MYGWKQRTCCTLFEPSSGASIPCSLQTDSAASVESIPAVRMNEKTYRVPSIDTALCTLLHEVFDRHGAFAFGERLTAPWTATERAAA